MNHARDPKADRINFHEIYIHKLFHESIRLIRTLFVCVCVCLGLILKGDKGRVQVGSEII